MPEPLVVFAFILATLLGAVCHLIVGGGARRLALFLLTGWFGFTIGHFAGAVLAINVASVGVLRVGMAAITALVALIVIAVLTSAPVRERANR